MDLSALGWIAAALSIIGFFIRQHFKVDKLERRSETLEQDVKRLTQEKAELQEQLEQAKSVAKQNPVKESLISKYRFDQHHGIYLNEAGQAYCPSCLKNETEAPLQVLEGGWRCPFCHRQIHNYDYQPPEPEGYDPLRHR